jgi:hypothetical protein
MCGLLNDTLAKQLYRNRNYFPHIYVVRFCFHAETFNQRPSGTFYDNGVWDRNPDEIRMLIQTLVFWFCSDFVLLGKLVSSEIIEGLCFPLLWKSRYRNRNLLYVGKLIFASVWSFCNSDLYTKALKSGIEIEEGDQTKTLDAEEGNQ